MGEVSPTVTDEPIDEEDIKGYGNLQEALTYPEQGSSDLQKDGVLTTDNVYGYHDADGTWHFFIPDDLENPKAYSSQQVTYIGTCKASELTNFTDDQATELAQILRDRPDSSISKYLSFDNNGGRIPDIYLRADS